MIYSLKVPVNFNDCCRIGSPNLQPEDNCGDTLAASNSINYDWLKGHSTDFTYEIQFTCHRGHYSICENSMMSSVALDELFQVRKKPLMTPSGLSQLGFET